MVSNSAKKRGGVSVVLLRPCPGEQRLAAEIDDGDPEREIGLLTSKASAETGQRSRPPTVSSPPNTRGSPFLRRCA
jgi:hypothetical protein